MAISLTNLNAGEIVFASDYEPIEITWSGASSTVTIQWSNNSGSGYTNIATGEANDGSYLWTLDAGEISSIFGANNEVTTMKIKVIDDGDASNDASTLDFTLRLPSFSNIRPNSENDYPIHPDALVNIVWTESYLYNDIPNVKIEYSIDAGANWIEIIASTTNNGSYPWIPSDDGINLNDTVRLAISTVSGTSPNDLLHTNRLEGTDFQIAANINEVFVLTEQGKYKDYPDRLETHARTAVEKAAFVDEAIPMGQLEAGPGIEIYQRDYRGALATTDPDPNPATPELGMNIVIASKNGIATGRPREMQGTKNFLTDALVENDTSFNTGTYYGKIFTLKILHNWDLGGAGDLNPATGKNKNSFMLEIHQVDGSGNRLSDDVIVQYEALNTNEIKLYCPIKGDTVDPLLDPQTIDDKVSLPKDEVGSIDSTYIFEWRLKEIIPT